MNVIAIRVLKDRHSIIYSSKLILDKDMLKITANTGDLAQGASPLEMSYIEYMNERANRTNERTNEGRNERTKEGTNE